MLKSYEAYAVLDAQIKDLTNKKDELRVKILEDLIEKGMQSACTELGKFTVSQLKTWTYTRNVEKMSEDLKALKATEESTGDASFEEKPSLRFTQTKL